MKRTFVRPTLPGLLALTALATLLPAARSDDPPVPKIGPQQYKDAIKAAGLNGTFSVTGAFHAVEGPQRLAAGDVRTIIDVLLETKEELARARYERDAERSKDSSWQSEMFAVAGGGPVKGYVGVQARDDDFIKDPDGVGGARVLAAHQVGNVVVRILQVRAARYKPGADLAARRAERQRVMEEGKKDIKERITKLAQALMDSKEKPALALDRVEGAPGSPLRIASSKGFQRGKRVRIYWDESILEDECLVDPDGFIALLPQRDDVRKVPWLWLFIPRNARDGMHSVYAEQEGTGLKTELVAVRVSRPDRKRLVEDFDAILERYKKDVPANPNSTSGATWNITRALAGPEFKCGDYQNKVLYFLTALLFNEDVAVRRLMDGFDFGPLMSGPAEIRFTHHFVVIWPRGGDWHQNGVILDPWGVQRPQALVLRPDAPPELAWWRPCYQYQPEITPRGLFIDRSTFAEFTSTPRADTLTSPGVHYPTHTDNPEFNYWDFIHGKKQTAPVPDGPAIPQTRVEVQCPVNVLIVERRTGKRLGAADGTKLVEEIAGGFCEVAEADGEKRWRFGLPEGDYAVTVTPYLAGEFRAKVIHSAGETWYEYPSVKLAADQKAEFSVEVNTAGTLTTTDGRKLTAVSKKSEESKESGEESDGEPAPGGSTRWLIGAGALVLLLGSGVLFMRLKQRRA
jgi:hypothetical protein